MVLSVLALGGLGMAGTAAADNGDDAPVYEVQVPNDGETYTVGIPGGVDDGTTVEDFLVDEGLPDGATVYAYDGDGWESGTSNIELDALDAIAVTTDEADEGSITFEIELATADPAVPGERSVEEGWNFVAPPSSTDADEVLDVGDAREVVDPFAGGNSPDASIEGDFTNYYLSGNGQNVSAFKGYFLYVESDDAIQSGIAGGAPDAAFADEYLKVEEPDVDDLTLEIEDTDLFLEEATSFSVEAEIDDEDVDVTDRVSFDGYDNTIVDIDTETGTITAVGEGTEALEASYSERSSNEITVTVSEQTLTFSDQAVGEDDGDIAVIVEDVDAAAGDFVAITNDDDDVVGHVGLDEAKDGDDVPVPVVTEVGEHTAHVVTNVSEETLSDAELSEETEDNVHDEDTAQIYEADVSVANQTYVDSTDEVTVETASLYDGIDDETPFHVAINDADDGTELGVSDELEGANDEVTVDVSENTIDAETEVYAALYMDDETDDPIEAADDGSLETVTSDTATITIEVEDASVTFEEQNTAGDYIHIADAESGSEVVTSSANGVDASDDWIVVYEGDSDLDEDDVIASEQLAELADDDYSAGDTVEDIFVGLEDTLNESQTFSVGIYADNESADEPDFDVERLDELETAEATPVEGDVTFDDQTLTEGDEEVVVNESDFQIRTGADDTEAGEYTLQLWTQDDEGLINESIGPIGQSGSLEGSEDEAVINLDEPLGADDDDEYIAVVAEDDPDDADPIPVTVEDGIAIIGDYGNLTVLEDADYQLSDLEPQDATADQHELPDYDVTVTNEGEAAGEQDVDFTVTPEDGDEPVHSESSETLELEGGESEAVTFDGLEDFDLEAGEYDVAVSTDDAELTTNLTVTEAPELDAHTIEVEGDEDAADLNVTVEETNDVETQGLEVTLEVYDGDTEELNETLALDELQDDQVEVEFDLDDLDAGSYDAVVTASADNVEDDAIAEDDFELSEVVEEHTLTVDLVDDENNDFNEPTDVTVYDEEDAEVASEDNVDDGTATFELVDGQYDVEADAGEDYQLAEGDVEIDGADDSIELTIEEVEPEDATIEGDVETDDQESVTEDVEVTVTAEEDGGEDEFTDTITLESAEDDSIGAYEIDELDAGDYDVTAAVTNDADYEIVEEESESVNVGEGDTETVDFTLTSTGD